MSDLVRVTPLTEGRVILEMAFTGSKSKQINIPEGWLPNFVRNSILSNIERYVNHRYQILKHHGGYITQRKMESITKLRLRLGQGRNWTQLALAKHILSMREDLIAIMPGFESKFYQKDSQLLADLHKWATDTINEHHTYYAAN